MEADYVLADGVINTALYHCLGPSIQTALFNAPLVVIVGWMIGKPMDLNFEIFMICLLVLSILVVGNFLRDGESNWLEGALLVVSVASRLPNPEPTDTHARSRISSLRSPPTTTRILTLPRQTAWKG